MKVAFDNPELEVAVLTPRDSALSWRDDAVDVDDMSSDDDDDNDNNRSRAGFRSARDGGDDDNDGDDAETELCSRISDFAE